MEVKIFMKRKILILSGLILWSICVFSKDLNIGIIFDNNSNFLKIQSSVAKRAGQ